ncbi:helix-turn-helix transcriptional regulator [Enterocloster citroniae]|uniref:helix-turn-helix domain-containing protein n=1 Tax=Enterocloster citroniae TaxID=358743 RepID=UPI001D093158|nr:helix-turn-helix transcriptional regulator [Enterocloster citroniae]MCB7067688.1 helix-turn-helix transcriptional regulator [Enterocloster citroniae]
MISYEPLWDTMERKGITTYKLIQAGIDKRTIHNLKHNENITMLTAEKLCKLIGCEIQDIVKFIDID